MATFADNKTAETDVFWMKQALMLAQKAAKQKEVPVGAIVVHQGQMIAQSYNRRESDHNPLAHAELMAIQEASRNLGRWRLEGCTLYVTLEPCTMCAGAIVNSRIDRVVYAAVDPKAGAVESLYQVLKDIRLNHQPEVSAGVMQEEASNLLKSFFNELRTDKKEKKSFRSNSETAPEASL